jgi:hypothetical protein
MHYRNELKAEFEVFVSRHGLERGDIPVVFTDIFRAFKAHLGGRVPLSVHNLGKMLGSKFYKYQNQKTNKQTYLLNKSL